MSTSGNGGGSLHTDNGFDGCPLCKGRGWVGRRVPVGHPEFGEVFPCRCQQADGEKNRKSALREYSNLGALARISFEETAPTGVLTDPESQRRFTKALARAEDYAENPEGWLALTGPSGCGKTHLAAAVANSLIDRGQTVLFVFVPDLLDHLRGAYSPDSPISYDDLFQQVKDASLLVLDDLGAQSGTPWAREKLLQIFNHRFNERMATVVTVRGPLERLEEGIRSRLQNPDLSDVVPVGLHDAVLLREVGGLQGPMLEEMTLDSFRLGRDVRGTAQEKETLKFAFEKARAYAESPKGWLLLTGQPGCGKTHLTVGIINERLKRGEPSFFAFVPALLDYLRATFRPDSLTGYDETFEQVKTAPFLALDDLGAENSTPWAEEKLYQIIVHRHNARLPTVITANYLSLKALEEAKPRIRSRLGDSLVEWAPILVPDYRDQRPINKSRDETPGGAKPRRANRRRGGSENEYS